MLNAYYAGPVEHSIVISIIPNHGAGVGFGSFPAFLEFTGLYHDNRLITGKTPDRAHEFPRIFQGITKGFKINNNALGLRVDAEEVDQVTEINIQHRS